MDFEQARFNMIEQQIRPWNVLDQDVLDTLAAVPREDFVPAAYRNLAFADVEIPLQPDAERTGEIMFQPRVEARLLQALAPRRHESALEIGSGSGYGTALLARHCRAVLSLERHAGLAAFATANLRRAGISNARVLNQDGSTFETGESFDLILLSGSVSVVPESLRHDLNPGGRLVAFTGDAPTMQAVLHTLEGSGHWRSEVLFETDVPRLHGFAEQSRFAF